MVELPEAYVLAKQLTETVTGRTIAEAVANHSPHGFAVGTFHFLVPNHVLPSPGVYSPL